MWQDSYCFDFSETVSSTFKISQWLSWQIINFWTETLITKRAAGGMLLQGLYWKIQDEYLQSGVIPHVSATSSEWNAAERVVVTREFCTYNILRKELKDKQCPSVFQGEDSDDDQDEVASQVKSISEALNKICNLSSQSTLAPELARLTAQTLKVEKQLRLKKVWRAKSYEKSEISVIKSQLFLVPYFVWPGCHVHRNFYWLHRISDHKLM